MLSLLLGRIIQALLMVAQIKLGTSILNPAQYGVWILIQTMAAFYILFGATPPGMYINRYLVLWEEKNFLPAVFKAYTAYLLLYSMLMILFTILFCKVGFLNFTVFSSAEAALLVFFLMFCQVFYQTWIPALNYLGKRREFVIGTSLGVFLGLAMVLALYFFGLIGVHWWVFSVGIGYFTSTFIFLPRNWFRLLNDTDWKQLKEVDYRDMAKYAAPLFLTTFCYWGLFQGYRLIVEWRLGVEELGKFAAGYLIISGITGSLESVLSSFYQPKFFQNISKDSVYEEELGQMWEVALYPYILCFVFLYLVSPILPDIFLGKKFQFDMPWLPLVALSEGGRILFNLLTVNFYGKKNTGKMILPGIGGLATCWGGIFLIDNLSFTTIILMITSGYLVGTTLLFMSDFKVFMQSNLLLKLFKAVMVGIAFLIAGQFIKNQFSGIAQFSLISLLGFVFSLPFLKRYMGSKLWIKK